MSLQGYVRAVARYIGEHGMSFGLRGELEQLRYTGVRYGRPDYSLLSAGTRKALELIDELLGERPPVAVEIETGDDWGRAANAALGRMEGAEREAWLAVLDFARTAEGSRPSRRWLEQARQRVDAFGRARFEERVVEWLGFLRRSPRDATYVAEGNAQVQTLLGHSTVPPAYLSEANGAILKGLVWCCALFEDDALAPVLGDAAEACFKKIAGLGARSTKAGNACIAVLGGMSSLAAVAQLQRLRQRVKYASAQQLIGKALEQAAQRSGMSRDDLEDLAVPTCGLEDGRLRAELGAYVGEIVVEGPQRVELRWYAADGSPRKTEPAEIKRTHAEELKALKQSFAEIRTLLPAQSQRIERLLLSERAWSLADWRARYLDHPLLAVLCRRLIWRFGEGERDALGAWLDGRIVGADVAPLDWLSNATRVRLWHPIGSEPATVLAWRGWLERYEITQPFKQAHREVYILTEAERRTASYSNRFAAHILRQHQLQALCQQRGWSYRLQGGFDGHDAPSLTLPRWGLTTEFWVEGILEDEGRLSAAGICLYVATDQVRFTRAEGGAPVQLDEVPAIVFSEVMRDVDLFVGVCSVGNDPDWADAGPDGYHGYWQAFAFGELSATAQTRRAVLERLLPRLKIADRCRLEERFLVVRGDLRTYRIHLGSGNVLMEPNSQYLCIVPGRGPRNEPVNGSVFLPFEGDQVLSVILSKAFLLADDRAIQNPTITSQIGRR